MIAKRYEELYGKSLKEAIEGEIGGGKFQTALLTYLYKDGACF